MTVYSDFSSYFWTPASNCLKNKMGIHNPVELDSCVDMMANVRISQLKQCPVPEHFDAKFLKSVHRVLFGDVYDWAGQFRTCDMARNQDYCPADKIASEVDTFQCH